MDEGPTSVRLRNRLRSTGEHLDQVVVQAVVELALETPFELRMFQVARMQVEVISVYRHRRIAELDDDLHDVAVLARGKIQQWMLVLRQRFPDASQRIDGHANIL